MSQSRGVAEREPPQFSGRGIVTYVLIGDDLDVLDVTSSLEDLSQDILGDSRVQTTNVQRTLVGFGGGAAGKGATAGRRHDLVAAHGRGNGGRDRVRVGWDVQRWRRHVGIGTVAIFVPRSSSIGLRGRRKLVSRNASIGHDCSLGDAVGWCRLLNGRNKQFKLCKKLNLGVGGSWNVKLQRMRAYLGWGRDCERKGPSVVWSKGWVKVELYSRLIQE